MEGDGFSDPRHRAARRRPRGGLRGRGSRQHHRRGSQKRPTSTNRPLSGPDLRSNEDRFRPIEDEDEENAYEAGVDFHEAASQPMYDPSSNTDLQSEVNLSSELSADFSKLEPVLASVPLWIRLGEHTRFALGVPEDDKIENYLDPLPSDNSIPGKPAESKNKSSEEFLKDLADLSFEDDHLTTGESKSQTEGKCSNEIQTRADKERATCMSPGQNVQRAPTSSQAEETDDFDKWLDEI